MLVDCPDCGRSYRLEAAALGMGGRVVICPRCEARWFQRGAGRGPAHASSWSAVRTADRPATRSRRGGPAAVPEPAAALDAAALAAGRSAPSAALLDRIRLAVTALGLAGLAVTAVAARAEIVSVAPRTASFYAAIGWPVNLRGFRFGGVKSTRAAASPADVTVSGELRNITRRRLPVPRLVFEVRDGEGTLLARWSESPPEASLPAGRSLSFASRAQRMPAEGRSVTVRFADPWPDEGSTSGRQQISSR